MAGPAKLNGIRGRLLVLVAGVLLLHGIALESLARLDLGSSLLKPVRSAVFTRLLTPQAPVSPPAATPAPVAAATPRAALLRPQTSRPRSVTPTQTVSPIDPPPAPAPALPDPPVLAQAAPATEAPALAPAAEAASAPAAPTAPASPVAAAPLAGAAPPGQAGPPPDWPVDTRLSYRVGGRYRGNELHGKAQVQWQREGAAYQNRIEIDLLLTRMVLTSQGEAAAGGLLPKVYEETRSGKSRGVRIGEGEVMFADGRTARKPEGVQDTASQFVELSWRFATGREKLEVGRAISFWMARPGAVDLWTYDIVARSMLQTARLGEVEAFHLKPRPIANPRGNITAEMWFAPSLQYLPVRIKVSMGDETYVDLLVERIEQK